MSISSHPKYIQAHNTYWRALSAPTAAQITHYILTSSSSPTAAQITHYILTSVVIAHSCQNHTLLTDEHRHRPQLPKSHITYWRASSSPTAAQITHNILTSSSSSTAAQITHNLLTSVLIAHSCPNHTLHTGERPHRPQLPKSHLTYWRASS